MKRYTSEEAIGNFYMMLILGIIALIVGGYGAIVGDVLASCIVAPPVLFLTAYESYKFSVYTIKDGNVFCSYLFKKRLCTVSTEQKIYYKIFIAIEGDRKNKRQYQNKEREFIMFSNEPFEYKVYQKNIKGKEDNFLHRYDCNKQILMPYDSAENILFLEIEKWDRIRLD